MYVRINLSFGKGKNDLQTPTFFTMKISFYLFFFSLRTWKTFWTLENARVLVYFHLLNKLSTFRIRAHDKSSQTNQDSFRSWNHLINHCRGLSLKNLSKAGSRNNLHKCTCKLSFGGKHVPPMATCKNSQTIGPSILINPQLGIIKTNTK